MTRPTTARLVMGILAATAVVPAAAARQNAPRVHQLPATPETVVWGYYSATAEPVLRIASGDIVEVVTMITNRPGRLEQAGVPPEQVQQSLRDIVDQVTDRGPGGHILNGPIYVEGAERGDVLEVRILLAEDREVILQLVLLLDELTPNSARLFHDLVRRVLEKGRVVQPPRAILERPLDLLEFTVETLSLALQGDVRKTQAQLRKTRRRSLSDWRRGHAPAFSSSRMTSLNWIRSSSPKETSMISVHEFPSTSMVPPKTPFSSMST